MDDLLERRNIGSRGVATTGYDPERRMLNVEYYNGLVYRYFGVSPHTGAALFEWKGFGRVLQTQVVNKHGCKLVEKLYPVCLG
jgi:hypothetical protein